MPLARNVCRRAPNSAAPVPMPQLLEQHLQDWVEKRFRSNPDDYLFINGHGRPYRSVRVVRDGIHRMMEKLGITVPERGTHAGIHAFRHGATSELLQAGTLIHLVTRMMRPADSRVTLDHYAHTIGDAERAASENLARRIAVQLHSGSDLDSVLPAKSA